MCFGFYKSEKQFFSVASLQFCENDKKKSASFEIK